MIASLDLITIEVVNKILGSHVFSAILKVGMKLVTESIIGVKVGDIS